MKSKRAAKSARPYEQKARALAAEASTRKILESFLKRAEDQWFEDITLDSIAHDAGVTVQTVLRKFGGKAGVLEAAHQHLGENVQLRRVVDPGNIDRAIDALTRDYEEAGRLVLRLLSQEDRHPMLHPIIERGRQGHRKWLSEVFAAHLQSLPAAKRSGTLDALVVATDIHVWKVVRLEMGRTVPTFKSLVKRLIHGVLNES